MASGFVEVPTSGPFVQAIISRGIELLSGRSDAQNLVVAEFRAYSASGDDVTPKVQPLEIVRPLLPIISDGDGADGDDVVA